MAAAAVWWMAPFLSAGGYASEAVAFAMALAQSPYVQPHKLWISQHGDGVSRAVVQVAAPRRTALQKSCAAVLSMMPVRLSNMHTCIS